MKIFYQKHPLFCALFLIALYVVLGSVLLSLSAAGPLGPLYPLLFHLAFSVFILVFLRRSGHLADFGIARPQRAARRFLFYIPLALAPLVNFLYPFAPLSPLPTLIAFCNMLLVGLLEELIFRGFLFRAMYTGSPRAAITVSSLTFGIGHIVNLLNGAPPLATLCQIVYAAVWGFLFVILLIESGSLYPAILAHSAMNASSVFVDTAAHDDIFTVITALILSLLGLLYLVYLWHHHKKNACKGDCI